MDRQEYTTDRPGGIQKARTGIDGFDEITRGGLPLDRTTLVVGGPGSGKTVFALQFLVNGARMWGVPGIFVAFEENSRQLIANAASFGWDLPALEREKLFFLDARMSTDTILSGNFDLAGLLASLRAKADEMGAQRIVFDSIGVLLSIMDDPIAERQELYRVHDWLSASGLTGIISARLEGEDMSSLQRYDFLQFMSDCIIMLHHRVNDRVSQRELRVVKYRGSGFSENEFPMVIGSQGIEVGTFGYNQPDYPVFTERISTGIQRLDTMLLGGYFRGSSTLITGSPGTAKSTLAASFVEANCRRGETSLYVSFDESPDELVRNVASVGIELSPHIEAGRLHIYSMRSNANSAEEHLFQIKKYIDNEEPSCLVVDPISAMLKAGGPTSALSVAQRLLHLAKSRGITTLLTSLLEGSNPEVEASKLEISTIADNWIHLSYISSGGERNRALTIVKSRGTAHSNQVRELVLTSGGASLEDVYTAGGEVLMGTLRWERERAVAREHELQQAKIERQRSELQAAEAETLARIQILQRELDARRKEMANLEAQLSRLEESWEVREEDLRELRRADIQVDHRLEETNPETQPQQDNQPGGEPAR